MIRRPPRSTLSSSSAASDVYKRQVLLALLALQRVSGQSTDATLSSVVLTCNQGTNVFGGDIGTCEFDPTFSSTTYSYTVSPSDWIKFTPTTNHAGATLTVDGAAVTSGSESQQITPPEGSRQDYSIVVTAQDGTTTLTYTFSAGKEFQAQWNAVVGVGLGSFGCLLYTSPSPRDS
eukprot:TRINITY_DN26824_c0_g1_i2.p1 TRINITY_DN26824_c0_g1~~TRINITY_DN26824_c0_g1_i2.p1  ORF type:complete len:176 (+),score=46.29 TRINITY_DN26824_c0_g1_i2:87-614(+)